MAVIEMIKTVFLIYYDRLRVDIGWVGDGLLKFHCRALCCLLAATHAKSVFPRRHFAPAVLVYKRELEWGQSELHRLGFTWLQGQSFKAAQRADGQP